MWIVKGQDILPWDNAGHTSKGLAAQAAKDGVRLPVIQFRLGGAWNGTVYGQSDYTTVPVGGTLVVEDHRKLAQAISDSVFGPDTGITTALYDIESWAYTPADQSGHPAAAITHAAAIARAAGVKLIVSPGGMLATSPAAWTAAAKAGVYMVAVQSQGWGWDKATQSWDVTAWAKTVAAAAKIIRQARIAAGTRTAIAAGLGTNTPLVHPAANLAAEYHHAQQLGIRNFWLNANNWGTTNRCTAAQGGYGCPQTAIAFFKAIGAI